MTRSVHHPPLRRLLMAAMFCGLVLGAGQPAAAQDGGGRNDGGSQRGNKHHPDSPYEQGYDLGWEEGSYDGRQACGSEAHHRDSNRRRSKQGRYDRGYADGYDDGHRAACDNDGDGWKPDPSYRQGYRAGYQKGFRNGKDVCDSDARHRDNRKQPNKSRYGRGHDDGYRAGHRAACG